MMIEGRLEKVERELVRTRRRNKQLLAAVGLAFALCLVGVAVLRPAFVKAQPAASVSKEIRANRFVLQDANANPRASLSIDKNRPVVRLCDANARHRIDLGLFKDGPTLVPSDENANQGAELSIHNDGPMLSFYGANLDVARMGVRKGGPDLALYDTRGKMRVWLTARGPKLSFYEANGERPWGTP